MNPPRSRDREEIEIRHLRLTGWIGLAGGLATLVLGFILTGGSALLAGEYWLAPQQWTGFGLTLLVVGLATTAVFALLLDVVEPFGRLRLLAAPPALVVALLWVFWLVVGLPTTQPGLDPQGDNFTVYYHVPDMLMATLIATLLMTLPLIAGRLRRSRSLAIK